MKKIQLGFFIFGFSLLLSFASRAQSNSLGDRAPEVMEDRSQKKYKPKVTRKQRLLFRKPNVRHTARYQYYDRVEEMAKEKQQISLQKEKLLPEPIFRSSGEYDFYKRVELAAKNKKRILREMSKPQYSDFTYFGHKRKPKRHLPYAMSYCKECGIRH
ncbi:MAG: hypothetical protein QM734_10630 [Cyclobacteriaceae bacterium]